MTRAIEQIGNDCFQFQSDALQADMNPEFFAGWTHDFVAGWSKFGKIGEPTDAMMASLIKTRLIKFAFIHHNWLLVSFDQSRWNIDIDHAQDVVLDHLQRLERGDFATDR